MSITRSIITDAIKSSFLATLVVPIDKNNIDQSLLLKHVIPILKRGDLVAFPTETVYGIGGNALDSNAVSKIFKAKGRPSDNPLIVHISNLQQLHKLIDPNSFPQPGSITRLLCDTFWPGPLTILFPKNSQIPNNVTAGSNHVAIRMPSHPIANKIIELSDLPLAAPSANKSGRPSPTCAYHVLTDLGRKVEPSNEKENKFLFGEGIGVGCIIDGGECSVGVESTVIRVDDFKILRPGSVTLEQLKEIDNRFELFKGLQNIKKDINKLSKEEQKEILEPSTPGLKYKHYSPLAPVYLFENNNDNTNELQNNISKFIKEKENENKNVKIGIIRIHEELYFGNENKNIFECKVGTPDTPNIIARNLFASFRYFDENNVDLIIMEGIKEKNEGTAVMNRARKAATTIF